MRWAGRLRVRRASDVWSRTFVPGLALMVLVAACGTPAVDEVPVSPSTTTAPATTAAPTTTTEVLGPEIATVAAVTAGDTIRVVLADGSSATVLLIGIEAPDSYPHSTDSTDFLTEILEGQEVSLISDVSDRDTDNRLLRYVYVGEDFINEAMVESGFAVAVKNPPDIAQADVLAEAQERAEANGEGQWSTTTTAAPTTTTSLAPTTTTLAPTTTTTAAPTTTTAAPTTTAPPASNCHPAYSSPCVPAGVSDVDCAGGSGNGPSYVNGPVYLVGSDDPYDLDGNDNDGVGCE